MEEAERMQGEFGRLSAVKEALGQNQRISVHPPFCVSQGEHDDWVRRVAWEAADRRMSADPAHRRRCPLPVLLSVDVVNDWPDGVDVEREVQSELARASGRDGRDASAAAVLPIVHGISHHADAAECVRALKRIHREWRGPVVVVAESAVWAQVEAEAGLRLAVGPNAWASVPLGSRSACSFVHAWHSCARVEAQLRGHRGERVGPERTWQLLADDEARRFTLAELAADRRAHSPVILYGCAYSGKSYELCRLLDAPPVDSRGDARGFDRVPVYLYLPACKGDPLASLSEALGLDREAMAGHLRSAGPLLLLLDALDEVDDSEANALGDRLVELQDMVSRESLMLISCRSEARARSGGILGLVRDTLGVDAGGGMQEAVLDPLPRAWLEEQIGHGQVEGPRPVPWDVLESRPALLHTYLAHAKAGPEPDLGELLIRLARDSLAAHLGPRLERAVEPERLLSVLGLLAVRFAAARESGWEGWSASVPMEAVAEWYQPSLRQRLDAERLVDARLQIQGVLEACGLLQTADRITGCETTGFAHEAMFEAFLRHGLREMVEDVERYAEMICGAGQRGRLLEGLARYLQRRTYYEPTAVTGFAELWYRIVELGVRLGCAVPVTAESVVQHPLDGRSALAGNVWSYLRVYRGMVHEAAGRLLGRTWSVFSDPGNPYQSVSKDVVAERHRLVGSAVYDRAYDSAVEEMDGLFRECARMDVLGPRLGKSLATVLSNRTVCASVGGRQALLAKLLPWLEDQGLGSLACGLHLSEALLSAGGCKDEAARESGDYVGRVLGGQNPASQWVSGGGFRRREGEQLWRHGERDGRFTVLACPPTAFVAGALWGAMAAVGERADWWIVWDGEASELADLQDSGRALVCVGGPYDRAIGPLVRRLLSQAGATGKGPVPIDLAFPGCCVVPALSGRAFVVGGWLPADMAVAVRDVVAYRTGQREGLWEIPETDCESFWEWVELTGSRRAR